MSGSRFVGRVGGLAVALGIGTAFYTGTAVALADSPSSDTSSVRASPDRSAGPSAANAGPRATSVSPGSGLRNGPRAALPGRVQKAAPASTVRTQSTRARSAAAPAAVTPLVTPAATITAAPIDPPVATAPEPVANDVPGAPVGILQSSLLLAQSRPETAAPPAPAATSVTTPAPAAAVLPAAGENIALIMGGSGTPLPSAQYIEAAFTKYVEQHSPVGTIPEQLVTPEGLYPITPYPYVKVLPLSVSVDQGNQILYDEVVRQLADDNTLTIFGYSQSAIISSLVMDPDNAGCVNTPTCGIDPDTDVNFVLIGNEMNPNGGFLSRFPGLNLPSLGIPFYGPTPEDMFPVANYMLEYDGFADFPQYPGNFLSSLNAALGIGFVHGTYLDLTPAQLATAIELPTSSDTQKYYVIPTENLPLLELVRAIPVIGGPIADLVQPALRVIVNLGYGDPKYGWSQGLANVETPFGVFPDVNWGETIGLFIDGIGQGINDFIAAITPGGSMWQELDSHATGAAEGLTSLAAGLTSLPALTPDGIIPAIQAAISTVTEFISNAAASLYAALLPTADIVNAIVTVLPGYAANLFLEGIEQMFSGDIIGGLINALARPVAGSIGLVTTAALIEVLVVANAITGIFTLE